MQETMKGAVLPGNRTVILREFPIPEPGPGQVLVKMKASTVCGSDIHGIYRRSSNKEIMVCTSAVRSAIREAKTHQIFTAIQTGSRMGMITMDQYLKNLYRQGSIDYEEAIAHSTHPETFDNRA